MRRCAVPLIVCLAAAAAPGHAEIYRWVDERGVTHYSNLRPEGGNARTLDPTANRVNIYSPVPVPAGSGADALMRQRIDALERQVQALRQSREESRRRDEERRRAALEQCWRDRRVDCDTQEAGFPAPFGVHPPVLVRVVRYPPPRAVSFGYAPRPAPARPATGGNAPARR